MHVLLIYCHPRDDSFCRALRDTAAAALRKAGHTLELRDLYAENFPAALSAAERARYHDVATNRTGIEDHVAALQRAEALLLVYPTWWYGMPALLKGWFDRVWSPGIAFALGDGAIQPLLTNIRRIGVITTYGSPLWLLWYIGWPDKKLIRRGLSRLCARDCRVDWLALTRMDTRPQGDRVRFLARVQAHLSGWR